MILPPLVFPVPPLLALATLANALRRCFLAETSATTTDYCILALATLGDVTKIGSFLVVSCCPRLPTQVKLKDLYVKTGVIADIFPVNFANVKTT